MEYEDQYDGSPARQVKPNTQFLSRMITGVTRGNQLAIDTNSSKAAQKAVGASGAASLRPALLRAQRHGQAAVRKVVLSAAAQQKLVLCSSLMAEVALSFGYKLTVIGPDGAAIPRPAAAQNAQGGDAPQQADGGAEEQQEGGEPQQPGAEAQGQPLQELVVTLRPMTRAQKVAAAAAGVGLVSGAAPDEEGYEEEYEEEEQAPAAPRVVPRGSAVLTRQALLAAKRATSPRGARPKLALGALDSIGRVLKRATGATAATATRRAAAAAAAATASTSNGAEASAAPKNAPKTLVPQPASEEAGAGPAPAEAAAATTTARPSTSRPGTPSALAQKGTAAGAKPVAALKQGAAQTAEAGPGEEAPAATTLSPWGPPPSSSGDAAAAVGTALAPKSAGAKSKIVWEPGKAGATESGPAASAAAAAAPALVSPAASQQEQAGPALGQGGLPTRAASVNSTEAGGSVAAKAASGAKATLAATAAATRAKAAATGGAKTSGGGTSHQVVAKAAAGKGAPATTTTGSWADEVEEEEAAAAAAPAGPRSVSATTTPAERTASGGGARSAPRARSAGKASAAAGAGQSQSGDEQLDAGEEQGEGGEAVNGSKRRALSSSLFGAAMRDIKKVKQVSS